jgi:hypothetical protein
VRVDHCGTSLFSPGIGSEAIIVSLPANQPNMVSPGVNLHTFPSKPCRLFACSHYQLGKKYQPSNRPKPTTREITMAMILVLDISLGSGMIHPFSDKSFFQAHVGI